MSVLIWNTINLYLAICKCPSMAISHLQWLASPNHIRFSLQLSNFWISDLTTEITRWIYPLRLVLEMNTLTLDDFKIWNIANAVNNLQTKNWTRMLAINVSIPNLIVTRLEQFRSPQLQIKRKRPTDVGVDWKQTILYTITSCRYLPLESICS